MNLLEANCLHEADNKLRRACGSQIESDLTLQVGLKWRWIRADTKSNRLDGSLTEKSAYNTLARGRYKPRAQQGFILPKPRKFQVARRTCRRCLDCFTEHAVRSQIAIWTTRTLA